jgi:hypothetical protein
MNAGDKENGSNRTPNDQKPHETSEAVWVMWHQLEQVSKVLEWKKVTKMLPEILQLPGINKEVVWFQAKRRVVTSSQFYNMLEFLKSYQKWFTEKQKNFLQSFLKKKLHYENSPNWFLKSVWRKSYDLLTEETREGIEEYSGYLYMEHNPSRSDKIKEHASPITNNQIIGLWEPIIVGWQRFRPLSYYLRLYPEMSEYLLERLFAYARRQIVILNTKGMGFGRLTLIPDGVIKSDNPSDYYDIISNSLPRASAGYVRYYSAQWINKKYGEEYDVLKFLIDASAIKIHVSWEYFYNSIEIDKIIRNDESFYSLDASETAWLDLLGSKKIVFWWKVYMRWDWRRFTENPYTIAYGQKNVVNFNQFKKANVIEVIKRLEEQLRISVAEQKSLNEPWQLRRDAITWLEVSVSRLRHRLQQDISIDILERCRTELTQLEIELSIATREHKLLSEKESWPIFTINKRVTELRDELNAYTKWTKQIPGNEYFIVHDGYLYVQEDYLIEWTKDFRDPIDATSPHKAPSSEMRYLDDELYIANPSIAFNGIDIDWDLFLAHIPKYSFWEWSKDAYKYKDIAKALILARFAYQDGVNRGVIIKNDSQWINLDSNDAIDDLADSMHRWREMIRRIIKGVYNDIYRTVPRIDMHDFDSGSMMVLYEKNAVMSIIDNATKSDKVTYFK